MKNSIYIAFLFITSLWAAHPACGQTQGQYLVSEENWLPNRTIHCIFQDSEGFLWVGTGSGLYRYDGYEVKHFATHPKKTNTLFTNRVTNLGQDARGRLVVSLESGLSLFDQRKQSFTTLSRDIERFGQFRLTDRGDAWIKAESSRLYRFSGTDSLAKNDQTLQLGIERFPEFADQVGEIFDFTGWGKRDLLIGSEKGLFRFDPVAQRVYALQFNYSITVLKILENGRILIGTQNSGIFEITIDHDKASIVQQYQLGDGKVPGGNRITSISEGPHGEVLASTRLAYYLADNRDHWLDFRLPAEATELLEDNNIETTYIDRAGVMWIGTLRGLLKVRSAPLVAERIRVETSEHLPLNQQVNFVFKENERRYWLKMTRGDVFVYDPLAKKFAWVNLPPDKVARFNKSEKGYLQVYGTTHVFRLDSFSLPPKTTEVMTSSQLSWSVEIRPGEWWFGRNRYGLIGFSDTGKQLYGPLLARVNTHFNQVSTISAMMRDSEQNIWIGSRGDGLLRVNLKTGELKKYSGMNQEGSISRRILHLKEDSRGRIWIASREGGLYRYEPETDSFRQFTTAHGLPSNVVCAIAEDKAHRIVVSTDNGLGVYQEGNPVPFRAYGQRDGIKFTDFEFAAVVESKNGDIYFGNSNGLYRVHIVEPPVSTNSPFQWTDFQIIKKEDSLSQLTARNTDLHFAGEQPRISLMSTENSFEVSFALLNFTDPDKNRYAYRMSGQNDEWQYILDGKPRVYFHDLKPGAYELEVKTADSYGRWMDAVHSLTITVVPPFWNSRAAYLFYAFLIALIALLLYRMFRRMKSLRVQLAEEVELAALKEQQMIYFSDLSHEIKNRLSMILGPLEKALSGKKVNQAVLNNLYEQTLRLKRISDQIMNLRMSEAGEFLLEVSEGVVFAALERLCQETEPLAIVRDVRLRYTFGPEPATAWFDEEVIEIILLNLLNNAIKYTPSSGTVHVKGEVVKLDKSDLPLAAPDTGQYLKCSVSDTGIGIPADEVKQLFDRFYRASNARQRGKRAGAGIGLDMVARLIRKHRGIIDIVSQEGDGTRVDFYLPIEKKHFNLNEVKLSGQSVPILEKLPNPRPAISQDSPAKEATLLLVDDEPDILEYLDENLKAHFALRLASDGEEAWNILLSAPVDLIISDLSMPGMNGLELLQNVRSTGKLKHIPFIMLTGRNSEAQKLTCLQNGVDDFIDKPFSVNLILWRVRNLIENRQLLRSQFGRKITVEPLVENDKSANELFIEQVVNLIEKNLKSNSLSVEFLAEECAMSRATFYRKMESLLDQPPAVFIRTYRLKKAAKLLQSGNYYVAEVAFQTGFSSPKYFSKCFQKEFGSTPTEYIKTLADGNPN